MAQIPERQCKLKSGETVTLKTPGPEYATQLIAHAKSVMSESIYTLTEADEFDMTVEQEAHWLQQMLDHKTKIVLVCEYQGKVIANLDFTSGRRRRIFHHGDFGMGALKDWWSKGLGTILLGALIDWATENPTIEKINLKVHSTNLRAIGLYKKFGFKEEGLQMRDLKLPSGDYVDSLLMARFVK